MVWCKFTDKLCSITSWFPESKEVGATIHVVPNASLPFSLTSSHLCLEIKIPSFQTQPDRYFQWNQFRQSSLSKRASQGVSVGKESSCHTGDMGSIPGVGRSLGGGNGNPLQYSCLENPMGRGAWWATYSPWGHKESRLKQLSMHMLYKWNHKA